MIVPIYEMLKHRTEIIQDLTKDGACSRCGECCGDFLPLSAVEIDRIRTYIRKHNIREQVNNVIDTPINFKCPFRDDSKHVCTIYEIRPEICRCFMCNYEKDKIDTSKKLFHQKNQTISMRGTFFGNELNQAYLAFLIGGIMTMKGEQHG